MDINLESQKYCFFILCMGRMNKSALLSLQSIEYLALKFKFLVYICADTSGKNWILENFGSSTFFNFIELESSKIPLSIRYRFENDSLLNYSKFGTDAMKLITPLKWQGLLNIFETNQNMQTIIYSDLDVIWLDTPSSEVEFLSSSNYLALIQDDTPLYSQVNYCTGIQIWRASESSLKVLNLISDFQISSHLRNVRYWDMLLGDEKAFNYWLSETKSHKFFRPLSPAKFVIGHGVKKALFWKFFGSSPIAVHANYTLKESKKFDVLNAFTMNSSRWKSRIKILVSR